MSTLRPLMTYLASTGSYGDFPLGGEAQAKLLEDAGKVNRVLALWRGITQNVAPGSIAPQILAKDKEGELHVQALMFNDFLQIRSNNPDSYEIAVAKWADKYGESALFALVSGSRGGITPTGDAWNFYQNNRKDANALPNALPSSFPVDNTHKNLLNGKHSVDNDLSYHLLKCRWKQLVMYTQLVRLSCKAMRLLPSNRVQIQSKHIRST